MSYCDTCGHQLSDICGGCESLEGVPVKYTEKGSKTIVPICGTCVSKEHCAVAKCSHYEKRLKLTNADRIRNMSDEALANWHSTVSCNKWHSAIDWLEWLKQEVSDDS